MRKRGVERRDTNGRRGEGRERKDDGEVKGDERVMALCIDF